MQLNVSLQGKKIPFSSDWIYFVYVDGERYDVFSTRDGTKLTAQEMLDVEFYYAYALEGYDPPGIELSDYEKKRRGYVYH